VPVVTYVNTSADVKAESDICCTSANAVKVVESLGVDKVIFLPDHYLANYVQKNTKVKIISWQGTCIVHEKFTGKEVEDIKKENPDIKVIAHPECPPDVISASDFAGSTSSMVKYVKEKQPKKVLLVTECSMSDNVQVDNPNVQFIKPCNLCPHMKKITLNKVYDCLKNETNEIKIGHNIAAMARKSVQRMAAVGR
jgi:Quinolinate synthase